MAALREVEGYERAEVGVRAEGAAQIAVITLPGGGGPVEGLEVDLTEYPGKPPLGLLPPGTGDAERERFAQAFVAKVSGGFRRGVGRPWCPGCVALAGRTARRQCAGPDWRALSSRLGPGPGPGRGGAGPGQVLAPSLAGAERGCGRRGGVTGCERVQKMALLRATVTRLNTTPPRVSKAGVARGLSLHRSPATAKGGGAGRRGAASLESGRKPKSIEKKFRHAPPVERSAHVPQRPPRRARASPEDPRAHPRGAPPRRVSAFPRPGMCEMNFPRRPPSKDAAPRRPARHPARQRSGRRPRPALSLRATRRPARSIPPRAR